MVNMIEPSFDILDQAYDLEGIKTMITKVGYTCYKTEKEITPEIAEEFINGLITRGHGAMLEHGTVYLKTVWRESTEGEYAWDEKVAYIKYKSNPYSKVHCEVVGEDHIFYITTNYRVLVENNWLKDLRFLCEPTEYHIKRYTVKFITDRGVSHELVRHRTMSFAQESTRYCNYSKDKFGSKVTYIRPSWYGYATPEQIRIFENYLNYTQQTYFKLLEQGWSAQQARQVLPNALKTEIVVTGFIDNWVHFFNLRALGKTGYPHPDMLNLALPLYNAFIKRGYLKELED